MQVYQFRDKFYTMSKDLIKQIVEIENDADDFGFMWSNPHQIIEQIQSECKEIEENLAKKGTKTHLQEEVGDLMHATFSLCCFLDFDPEETLIKSVEKLEKRIREVKRLAKEKGYDSLRKHSFEGIMALWNEAKGRVG